MAEGKKDPPPVVQMTHHGDRTGFPSSMEQPNEAARTTQREDNIFCLSTPFDILIPCNYCFIVPEKRHIVELFFGRYHGTITKPGCYCRSIIAVELRRVGTDLISYDLPNTKVLDLAGSPVIISGIITYEVVDARRAAIDVNDPNRFVQDQAPAVLKRVVSQFPYESPDNDLPCLRTETSIIANRMRDELQQRVDVAGVRIHAFNINELSYAPEIAHVMLRRQQADALVAARRAIVRGAREIATDAIRNLPANISEEQRSALLCNLLVVMVGDRDVVPTLPV